MSRSLWKGPFSEIKTLLKGNQKFLLGRRKIWSRRSMVLPSDLGKEFLIHNGKNFIPLRVEVEMVGHRFGEFSNTRKRPFHKVKKRKSSPIKKK
jgi:small subunit ribosomal protein S19